MQANTADVLRTDKMVSWREKRAMRAEFKSLGTRQVRESKRISLWHATPGKLEEARRWLQEQERPPYLRMTLTAAAATIIGAILGALLTAWLRC
jgi:hypothetical protein